MKRVLMFTVAAALAAAALAADFVREGFEGSTFPPAGWKVQINKPGAGWSRGINGPWGSYAHGGAYAAYDEVRWATLSTYEFGLPAQTEIYYGFYHCFDIGGNGGYAYAKFYITYVNPPGGYLVEHKISRFAAWEYLSGHAFNRSAARVKAVMHVEANAEPRRYIHVDFDLDRVTITDGDPTPVEPASLGRVKALFR